ncbi:MAG: ATP-binding protein [Actinomycetota bacterium]
MPWRLAAAVRFAVAAAIATYALTYEPPPGTAVPAFVTPVALAVALDLIVLAILQARAKITPDRGMRALYLVADIGSPIALLYLYSFDPRQHLFVLLFVSMAQGALALRLVGALLAWGVSASAYGLLQVYAAQTQIESPVAPLVVGLRIFIMLVIAVVIAKLTDSLEKGAIARAAAERSLRFQASLLENVTDAVLATDLDMNVTAWNPAAEAIYGWRADEVLGRPLHEILNSTMIGDATDLASGQLADSGSWSGEFVQHRRDGGTVYVEAKGLPLRDDHEDIIGYVTVNREITDRRRALEARIHATHSELANRTKDEFLSRMSHELRTPLNAILGFTQLLAMDDPSPDKHSQLQEIMAGGQHLLSLIDEILDISRIQSDHLDLVVEPVSVAGIVEEATGMVSVLARGQGVTLTVDPDGQAAVLADGHRLKQALLNLLSNAIKFNRPDGSVSVSCMPTDEGYVRIGVQDTGPGIARANLERIFEPFERLGSAAANIEGTGLGLPLSKSLVEAMGGQLGVDSTVGAGSTFWIELPATKMPSVANRSEPPAGNGPEPDRPCRVLYVEDHPGNIRLVESALARRPNVKLIVARNGQMGLDLAIESQPDLILLDVHLPDMPGDEVLRTLQHNVETRRIPVVAISADATDAQRQRMLAVGAIDYLRKPLDITRLLELIDDAAACVTTAAALEGRTEAKQ